MQSVSDRFLVPENVRGLVWKSFYKFMKIKDLQIFISVLVCGRDFQTENKFNYYDHVVHGVVILGF